MNGNGSSTDDKSDKEKDKSAKKSRRNTLTVMVEPISRTIKNRAKGRNTAALPSGDEKYVEVERPGETDLGPRSAIVPGSQRGGSGQGQAHSAGVSAFATPARGGASAGGGAGLQASTNKAVKVMQWFRNKSKARDSIGVGMGGGESVSASEEEESGDGDREKRSETPTQSKYRKTASSSTINQDSAGVGSAPPVSATPSAKEKRSSKAVHPQRTPSSATDASSATPSFVARFRNSVTVGGAASRERERERAAGGGEKSPVSALRLHHGPMDQETITSLPPPEVMKKVREVLVNMGVEIQVEGDFKYKCVRPKKKAQGQRTASGSSGFGGNGVAAFAMSGSAASNGVSVHVFFPYRV